MLILSSLLDVQELMPRGQTCEIGAQGEVWIGDVHLRIFSIQMISRARQSDEISWEEVEIEKNSALSELRSSKNSGGEGMTTSKDG